MKPIGHDVWACLFFFRNYIPETRQHVHGALLVAVAGGAVLSGVAADLVSAGAATRGVGGGRLAASLGIYKFWAWSRPHSFFVFQHTELRADGLLVGCLLALVLKTG